MQHLQQLACRNNGYAVIHSKILVDENGEPVYWMEPDLERIEPRRGAKTFLDQILGMLEHSNNS